MTLITKQIEFNSTDYGNSLTFRNDILRKPLGLDLANDDLDKEAESHHFCLFEKESIIACLVATPINATSIKIRQMAVLEKFRAQGLGKKLMSFVEDHLTKKGFQHFELNARDYAIPFYLKLGYNSIGENFEEVGIPHTKMIKKVP